VRAILVYALLRGALFVVPFAILVAAQVPWYVALVVALLFAFAASSIFLRRQKVAAAAEIARMRGEDASNADEDAEDRAIDAEDADASASPDGADRHRTADADADASSPTASGEPAAAEPADASDERTDR
jgi:hypothetical protein